MGLAPNRSGDHRKCTIYIIYRGLLYTGGRGWVGIALMQHRQQVELNNAKVNRVTWRVSE